MRHDSSATDDSGMPPIPKFNFQNDNPKETDDAGVGEQDQASKNAGSDSQQSSSRTKESSNPNESKDKSPTKRKKNSTGNIQVVTVPVTFSTEVRRSIRIDLALISHERKMSGRKDYTIKQLIHEALILLLESPAMSDAQREKKRKLMQFPDSDPYDTFNNRISFDVNRQLAKMKFDREGILHPVRTKIALTEEALINWIPLQGEFSVEKRNQRLAQLAA